jgi:uncharacterized protein (DUF2267 family)
MNENDFLRRVQELGVLATREDAERWSMAVLGALSDLIADPAHRRHFGAQLPSGLKTQLLAGEPRAYDMDPDGLVQRVARALNAHAPEGTRAVRVVYRVLKEAVSPGQIAEFEGDLSPRLVTFLAGRE